MILLHVYEDNYVTFYNVDVNEKKRSGLTGML